MIEATIETGKLPQDEAEAPLIRIAARVLFGRAGNSEEFQEGGWSNPEDGYTWIAGPASRIRFPYLPGDGVLMLELIVSPNLHPKISSSQRLIVDVNGTIVGHERVYGEAAFSFVVPSDALDDSGHLIVTIGQPDSFKPSLVGAGDHRELGLAVYDLLLLWLPEEPPFNVRRRPPLMLRDNDLETAVRFCSGLAPADLMSYFESLGHNCEFGLVQRTAGAEPLGLLRFGGISIFNLLQGIDHAFEGIESPERLQPSTKDGRPEDEYIVKDRRYGVAFHTFQLRAQRTPDEIVAKFSAHLAFLRRMFQDTLETSCRIFVVQHPALRSQVNALPLLHLLRSFGPNVLLYVTEVNTLPHPERQPGRIGSVVQERADLFHGYIDELAPVSEAGRFNFPAWASICANTYRMWREQGGGLL